MTANIFLWGCTKLPLAVLLWLHRLYTSFVSLFVRDRSLGLVWEALREADTFEEWEVAGLELDHRYRIDAWRKDDKSRLYAWDLISDRLAAFGMALQAGQIQALVHLLQSGLVRNLGNMTAPPLYNKSFAGTKYLIENYILKVCEIVEDLVALPEDAAASPPSRHPLHPELARAVREGRCAPLLTMAQKRQLCTNLRQSFGRTTLVFQGGSVFGLCHLGVARALFLRGLLPRIITGSGTGALMAALLGTHTDEELPSVLDGDCINLTAFGKAGPVEAATKPSSSFFSLFSPTRLERLYRRAMRFWNEGYLLDVTVLERCVRDNGGDMTFEEAFRRTGRVLNITVVTDGTGDVPAVLNHVTAPNVLIWTAAVASNASEVAWYGHQPTPILCRDAGGNVIPWPLADSAQFRHWADGDGSGRGHGHGDHPPLQRLAQLFNVNHVVVSQARPYLVPFLEPSLHSPAMHGFAMGTLARLQAFLRQQMAHFLRHRLDQLGQLGLLPRALRRLLLDEHVPVKDRLVLVPHVTLRDYMRLLDPPKPGDLRFWIGKGERAVWPAVAALKIRCSIELALQEACDELGLG